MIKPIRPHEIVQTFPDEVIVAFNLLISKIGNKNSITILQEDVVKEIVNQFSLKGKSLNVADIYDEGWLDVEKIYRDAGWKVEYDKPGYNESYNSKFKFSKKTDSERIRDAARATGFDIN